MIKRPSPYRVPTLLGEEEVHRLVGEGRASRVLARITLTLFALSVIALALVPWQQNAPGRGRVIAYSPGDREQPIEAPIEGRVVRWYVEEGSRVRAGDPLADIADNDPEILSRLERERKAQDQRADAARARAAATDERVASLRASQRAAASAAQERVRMGQDRARAAEQGLRAAEAALETSQQNNDRQLQLFEKGLSSKRTVELAELELARARTEVERARAGLGAARAEVAALLSDQAKVAADTSALVNDATGSKASAQAEVAAAEAELSRIEVRVARQRTQAVKAPRDGTILRLVARGGGEFVKSGDTLAVLVPDTDARAVEIWIGGNDINLVRPGQPVRLQFEGWPAVQFAGWPSAAIGTFGAKVAFVDAADDGQGRFRVVVMPDDPAAWPEAAHLRQGTRVNGWILLNRVRLGYELWRMFNGFPLDWTGAPASADDGKKKGGSK